MERMMASVCSLQRRHVIKPRLRRLQLGGKRQQRRLLSVAAREMHTDPAVPRDALMVLKSPHLEDGRENDQTALVRACECKGR